METSKYVSYHKLGLVHSIALSHTLQDISMLAIRNTLFSVLYTILSPLPIYSYPPTHLHVRHIKHHIFARKTPNDDEYDECKLEQQENPRDVTEELQYGNARRLNFVFAEINQQPAFG
jgi:hypothetical protein